MDALYIDSLLSNHWSSNSEWVTGLYAAFPNATRDKNREGLIVRYQYLLG